ncbi:MAG TPA: ABC transporter ATP-binding protein [Polyangiales bacterium]
MSHAIEVSALRREFGAFVAVRDVSFQVERGEIFGYLGANGAGKSTTIKMLCGLLMPTAGQARVAGHDIARSPRRVKASIGYMSQKFSLYLDLDARANLQFFGGIYGLRGKLLTRAIDEVTARTDLREHMGQTASELPGGIRQRLALACAVMHRPQIVFLDEPTAGVDPASRRQFWRLIRALAGDGTTVFVTTHYMDEAEYCARIGLMVDGTLVALDTPDALKKTFVPGTTVEFEGQGLHRVLAAARKLPFVRAADLFGERLRVRFDAQGTSLAKVEAGICSAGAQVARHTAVEASLEEVFLAVVGRKEAA